MSYSPFYSSLLANNSQPRKVASGYPTFSNTEEDIIEQLNVDEFEVRLRTLNRIRTTSQQQPNWFSKFRRKLDLGKALLRTLADSNWEIQHQCVKLIADTIQNYGDDLDWFMTLLLPELVPKLASSKITVRRVTVQACLSYLQVSKGSTLSTFLKALVQHGISDVKLCPTILNEIPNLFLPELARSDWKILIDGLLDVLYYHQESESLQQSVLEVLYLISGLVGVDKFNRVVDLAAKPQREYYNRLTTTSRKPKSTTKNASVHDSKKPSSNNSEITTPPQIGHQMVLQPLQINGAHVEKESVGALPAAAATKYGIVPKMLFDQIQQTADTKSRVSALEQLRRQIEQMKEGDLIRLQPHLHNFIGMLSGALDDISLKVVAMTLEVLRVSIAKLKNYLQPHLQRILGAIVKHMGNQRTIIRQLNMMLVTDLMETLQAKLVVAELGTYMTHKNGRVREEVQNMLTVSLLTVPSNEMNLSAMSSIIVPGLSDCRRRVRLAAFECIASLAHALKSNKLEPLYNAVREYEDQYSVTGLRQAVQARVSRNQVPKIRSDGLLEYASPLDPDSNRVSSGADIDWIMGAAAEGLPSRTTSASKRSKDQRSFSAEKSSVNEQNDGDDIHERDHHSAPVRSQHEYTFSELKRTSFARRLNSNDPSTSFNESGLSNSRTYNGTHSNSGHHGYTTRASPEHYSDSRYNDSSRKVGHSPTSSYGQGKRILSPLNHDVRPDQSINQSRKKPDPFEELDDECSNSLDDLKFNAMKRRTMQNGVRRVHSTENVNRNSNVSSPDDRNDRPLKGTGSYALPDDSPRKTIGSRFKGLFRANSVEETSPRKDLISPTKEYHRPPIHRPVKVRQPIPSPVKPAPVVKTPALRRSSGERPPIATSSNKHKNNQDTRPPQQRLDNALKKLCSEEWTDKVDAITTLQSVGEQNPTVLQSNCHSLITALIAEVKNLRSSVSRQAMSCLSTLFPMLGRSMDPELDKVVPVLIAKSGETTNAFIREDALKALELLVDYASPHKILPVMLSSGASNKSAVVRCSCAQMVERLAQNMGADRVFASPKDFYERVMVSSAQFATDRELAPRQHGKSTLHYLSSDSGFSSSVTKLQEPQQRIIMQVVDNIRSKGVSSGASSCSTTGSKTSSMQRTGSIRRPMGKVSESLQDALESAAKNLDSTNWENRFSGVQQFHTLSASHSKVIASRMKLIESYSGRLNDINGKVALEALQGCPIAIEHLGSHMNDANKGVLSETLKSIMTQLASKNEDVRKYAQRSIESCQRNVDNSCLIQPFAMTTKSANMKQKPEMLRVLAKICAKIHQSRPKSVQMHALPVLWDLLKMKQGDPELRQATVEFATSLSKTMGKKDLLNSCPAGSLQTLKDMIDK